MPTANLLNRLKDRNLIRGIMILPSLVALDSAASAASCVSCVSEGREISIIGGFMYGQANAVLSGADMGPARKLKVKLKPELEYTFSITSTNGITYTAFGTVYLGCGVQCKLPGEGNFSYRNSFSFASGDEAFSPSTFTLKETAGENCKGGQNSQENSGPAINGSPPAYEVSPIDPESLQLSDATAELEIRVGQIGMGSGNTAPYRSAGLFHWEGPIQGALASPTNLEYLAAREVMGWPAEGGNPAIPAKVIYGAVGATSGYPNERHLVTPTRLFRVTGYATNPNVIGTFESSGNTYIREYIRASTTEAASATLANQPVSWWKITPYTSDNLISGLLAEQWVGGRTMTTILYSPTNQLVKVEGTTTTTTTLSNVADDAFSKLEVIQKNGINVSKTLLEFELIAGEPRLVQESRFPDPDSSANPLVTVYDYYHAGVDLPAGTEPGQLRWVSHPDGNWQYYRYGTEITEIFSPFASETYLDTGIIAQNLPPIGGSGRLRKKSTTELGSGESVVDDVDGSGEIIIREDVHYPDLSFTVSHPTDIAQSSPDRWLAGLPILTSDSKGKAHYHQYEKSGDVVTETVTSGTADYVEGGGTLVEERYFHLVPNLSDRVITTHGPDGVTSVERLYHTGSGFTSASTEQTAYDSRGRYTSTTRNGVVVHRMSYATSGNYNETEIDAQGRATTTFRNADNEVWHVSVAAGGGVRAQVRTYEFAGLTTTEKTDGVVTGITKKDGLGRVVSTTDATGATTTYVYTYGGRVVETIFHESNPPNPSSKINRIEENYWDGRTKSVAGNGVVNEFYTYDAYSGYTGDVSATLHSTGSATAHTARLTTSEYNRDGSLARILTPSPAPGGGTIAKTFVYSYGILVYEQSGPEGSTPIQTLIHLGQEDLEGTSSYAFGAEQVSGLNVHGSLSLSFGTADRFTKHEWSYVAVGGVAYRQTLSHVYPDGIEANALTTTQLDSLGFVSATASGQDPGYTEISEAIEPSGRSVKTTRQVFPTSATVITTVDDSATKESGGAAIIDSVATEINGYLQTVQRAGTAKSESYGYDDYGRVKQYTDIRGGSTWSFFYNATSQLEKVTNHLGQTTSYAYYLPGEANAGLVKTVTHPGGATTISAYNTRGQPTETSGTAGYREIKGYDVYGAQTTLETFGTQGALTRWVFQAGTGLLSAKRYNDATGTGQGYTYLYTADGKVSKRTSARGIVTDYTYHTHTRDLLTVTYSGDADLTPDLTYPSYDHLGRPKIVDEVLTGVTNSQTLIYQPHSGTVSTTYGSGHKWLPNVKVQQTADDASGRPAGFGVLVGSASQTAQAYVYDTLSRLGQVMSGDVSAAISYLPGTDSLQEQTVSISGQIIHKRSLAIDLLGRTAGVVNKARIAGVGNVLQTIASVGHGYDAAGRRQDARREDGTWWDYGYNSRSEVQAAVKKTATDTLVPGLSFGYHYDGIGNRKAAIYGTFEKFSSWSSDSGAPAGLPAGVPSDVPKLVYTPDALNQYTSLTHPGKLDILSRSDAAVTATAINATVNGIVQEGNLYTTRLTANNTTAGKQVTTNLLSGTSGTVKTWVPKASVTLTYDEDGNLTEDGRWTYTWDGENRLVSLVPATGTVANDAPDVELHFAYDCMGRRIAKTIVDKAPATDVYRYVCYAYDKWNPVAEWHLVDKLPGATDTATTETLNPTNLKRTHVWGLDIGSRGKASGRATNFQAAGGVAGLVASTYHNSSSSRDHFVPGYDANGNIISWTAADGATLQRSDFDPFGNAVLVEKVGDSTLVAKLPDYGFSTKPKDVESGLYYYGYRYYDPVTGRWPSRDPLEEIGGINIFGYVNNNALEKWDYLGRITGNIALGVGFSGTIILPSAGPSVGLSGSYQTAFHAFYSGSWVIPKSCGLCSTMSVTVLGGAGAGVNVGVFATLGYGPATSSGTLEGYSISMGAGAAVGGSIPGAPVNFGASVEHDLMTAQTTLDVDIPGMGTGFSAYAAVRFTGNLTACSSKLNLLENNLERYSKMRDYLKSIQHSLKAAGDQFNMRWFPAGSGSQKLKATGEVIIDDRLYGE